MSDANAREQEIAAREAEILGKPQRIKSLSVDELDDEARSSIRQFVALHAAKTASTRAQWLLAHWDFEGRRFVRLTPKAQA